MYLQRIYAVERSGNDNIDYIDSPQLRSVILLQNEEPSPPESPTPTHGGYINDSSWWMEKCDIVDTFCYLDSVLSWRDGRCSALKATAAFMKEIQGVGTSLPNV